MKIKKPFALSRIVLVGIAVWIAAVVVIISPSEKEVMPRLEFVEFRTLHNRPIPVFRLTNPSRQSFTYSGGQGKNYVNYEALYLRDGIWEVSPRMCGGTGFQHHELAPGESVDVYASYYFASRNDFSIKIYLVEGTPQEISARHDSAIFNL